MAATSSPRSPLSGLNELDYALERQSPGPAARATISRPGEVFQSLARRESDRLLYQIYHAPRGRPQTLPFDDTMGMQPNAENNVRARWVSQGIWQPGWGGAWPSGAMDLGRYPAGSDALPRSYPFSAASLATAPIWPCDVAADDGSMDVSARDASRPRALFLAQAVDELGWLRDQRDYTRLQDGAFMDEEEEVVEFGEEPDALEALARRRIRLIWTEDDIWRPEWDKAGLPGDRWIHQDGAGPGQDPHITANGAAGASSPAPLPPPLNGASLEEPTDRMSDVLAMVEDFATGDEGGGEEDEGYEEEEYEEEEYEEEEYEEDEEENEMRHHDNGRAEANTNPNTPTRTPDKPIRTVEGPDTSPAGADFATPTASMARLSRLASEPPREGLFVPSRLAVRASSVRLKSSAATSVVGPSSPPSITVQTRVSSVQPSDLPSLSASSDDQQQHQQYPPAPSVTTAGALTATASKRGREPAATAGSNLLTSSAAAAPSPVPATSKRGRPRRVDQQATLDQIHHAGLEESSRVSVTAGDMLPEAASVESESPTAPSALRSSRKSRIIPTPLRTVKPVPRKAAALLAHPTIDTPTRRGRAAKNGQVTTPAAPDSTGPRRRGRPAKSSQPATPVAPSSSGVRKRGRPAKSAPTYTPVALDSSAPRKRGRPAKSAQATPVAVASDAPKRRGRPAKTAPSTPAATKIKSANGSEKTAGRRGESHPASELPRRMLRQSRTAPPPSPADEENEVEVAEVSPAKKRGRPSAASKLIVALAAAEHQAEMTPAKKRGRPRKSLDEQTEVVVGPATTDTPKPRGRPRRSIAAEADAAPAPPPPEPTPRRPGRPRKSETLVVAPEEPESGDDTEPEPTPTKRRGRGSQKAEQAPAAGEDEWAAPASRRPGRPSKQRGLMIEPKSTGGGGPQPAATKMRGRATRQSVKETVVGPPSTRKRGRGVVEDPVIEPPSTRKRGSGAAVETAIEPPSTRKRGRGGAVEETAVEPPTTRKRGRDVAEEPPAEEPAAKRRGRSAEHAAAAGLAEIVVEIPALKRRGRPAKTAAAPERSVQKPPVKTRGRQADRHTEDEPAENLPAPKRRGRPAKSAAAPDPVEELPAGSTRRAVTRQTEKGFAPAEQKSHNPATRKRGRGAEEPEEAPVPKKRGRPSKQPTPDLEWDQEQGEDSAVLKRRGGRSPKYTPAPEPKNKPVSARRGRSSAVHQAEQAVEPAEQNEEVPAPRRRGRPAKQPEQEQEKEAEPEPTTPKRRGRPPKNATAAAVPVSTKTAKTRGRGAAAAVATPTRRSGRIGVAIRGPS